MYIYSVSGKKTITFTSYIHFVSVCERGNCKNNMASLTVNVSTIVEEEIQQAKALDAVQLRLAIKQLRKARIKIDKLNSGYVKDQLKKTLERTMAVLALVSVPRGGCIGENQGVGTTIAAMGSEIVSREDLIVLFTHVIFLQNNFMCQCSNGALPTDWSDKAGGYSITYTHPKIDNFRIGLKGLVVDGKILLHVGIDGDSKVYDFETNSNLYLESHVKIPNDTLKLHAKTIDGTLQYARAINSCFKEKDGMKILRGNVETELVKKILNTAGSNGNSSNNNNMKVEDDKKRQKRSNDNNNNPSLRIPPTNPFGGVGMPSIQPPLVNVGHDDLGPNLGGMMGGVGRGGGGGSLVGPNHPMFNGRNNMQDPRFGGGRGQVPPGVPPGARFDPFGPGVPRPRRFPQNGRGRGGFTGGMPDNDHLRMPGGEEDFMYM